MPRDAVDDFLKEKNKSENEPVWLYRIQTSDNPAEDLFLAEYPVDVSYFKDADTPQVYRAFPINHSGFGDNRQGTSESLTITISNVSLEVQSYLEISDGLRQMLVTVRAVFIPLITDPYAYREDEFVIDTVRADSKNATFSLATHYDVQEVETPLRRYHRNTCPFKYKQPGCWTVIGGVLTEPVGFVTGDPDSCSKTLTECDRHANKTRYGGFPSIPRKQTFLS